MYWGAWSLVCTCCIHDAMSQIGSLLFEAISDIPDYIVITELTIGLEFAQIYQF